VLFDAGADGEDVGSKTISSTGRPAWLGQQPQARGRSRPCVRPVGLAFLVECHDDHGRARTGGPAAPGQELFLALL